MVCCKKMKCQCDCAQCCCAGCSMTCSPAGCTMTCCRAGFSTVPMVGKAAPHFECEAVGADGEIRKVNLSDFMGSYVLLFFYPLDFTFVCPSEIIAFDKVSSDLKNKNVALLGCSIDSPYVHTAWRNTELKNGGIGKIQYPLLSDVSHKISKDYGVLLEAGMALRGLFLIDKNGIMQHALVNNLPIGRSVDEAVRIVDALQFHEEHGDVCPANWKKGVKAMKPTAAGVASYLSTQ